jgi:hypothetical protein
MELTGQEVDRLGEYLQSFDRLIGDERTGKTFTGVIEGIIASESLCATQIGRFSPYAGRGQVWRTAGQTHGQG